MLVYHNSLNSSLEKPPPFSFSANSAHCSGNTNKGSRTSSVERSGERSPPPVTARRWLSMDAFWMYRPIVEVDALPSTPRGSGEYLGTAPFAVAFPTPSFDRGLGAGASTVDREVEAEISDLGSSISSGPRTSSRALYSSISRLWRSPSWCWSL